MAAPWEKYQQQPANPVIAPPDPYREAGEQRAQQDQARQQQTADLTNQVTALTIQEKQRELADEADQQQQATRTQADAKAKLENVIGLIDEIAFDSVDNSGWFETGATGAMARGIPGTAAYDLAGNVKTIDANAAFNALAEMRANSPTGGALGQITERELDLLKSSVANLDTAQSQGQFFANLAKAKKIYLDMLGRLDPETAQSYQGRRGIRFNPDGSAALFYTDGNDTREQRDAPFLSNPGGGGQPPGGGSPSDASFLGMRVGDSSDFMAGVGDVAQGAGDVIGLFGNPLNATINAATGSNLSTDLGETLRTDVLGIPHGNQAQETINRYATGAMTGSGLARGVAAVANPGLVQSVANAVGRTPIRDALAGAGAGSGAVAGRASGVPGGEAVGTVLGGLAGYGGAGGVNALARVARPGPTNALGQAAARQGVNLLPADAGGEATRILTSGAKVSPLSAGPIRNAARRNQTQMQSAVRRTVGDSGDATATTDQAGESVRGAARRYGERTAQTGERLYTRAYAMAKGVKSVRPVRTVERLDAEIARLQANPAAPEGAVAQLQSFRDKIAGGVGIQGLRDARTLLSQGVFDGKLRSGPEKAMWKGILAQIGEDIDAGLRSGGRNDAADAFRAADSFWEQRVQHIDEVLEPIVNAKKGGEEVIGIIERMARGQAGGNARLSRFLSEMKPEEAANVRAVIIDRLGRATPGQQDAAGEAFSASTFLTNWNRLTPQAKTSLFTDTKLRGDLNDLALLAENMKASQSMANHSNTAMALTGGGNAVGAYAVAAALHPVFAILGAGSQLGLGKLLASPGFARLLTRTAKMPPEQAGRALTEQLGLIAGRQPLVANDARAVQQFLSESFARSPGRAAAEQEQD